jgi:SAM-dependent methyltransferase
VSNDDVKHHAQTRFAQYAQGYVTSKSHAAGADLERLLELAQPQTDWLALDVATGGGHTALKFAPYVACVVASDLTPTMLNAARAFISKQGAANVMYSAGDAENLPFLDESFDLVTCRIEPQDHLAPDNEPAARYLDAFERLRDPSHVRAFSDYEWRGMFLDAGLSIQQAEPIVKSGGKLVPWAERQGCTPQTIERLQVMLAHAPAAVAEWVRPQCVGTRDASFDHHYLIIAGRKEA